MAKNKINLDPSDLRKFLMRATNPIFGKMRTQLIIGQERDP